MICVSAPSLTSDRVELREVCAKLSWRPVYHSVGLRRAVSALAQWRNHVAARKDALTAMCGSFRVLEHRQQQLAKRVELCLFSCENPLRNFKFDDGRLLQVFTQLCIN